MPSNFWCGQGGCERISRHNLPFPWYSEPWFWHVCICFSFSMVCSMPSFIIISPRCCFSWILKRLLLFNLIFEDLAFSSATFNHWSCSSSVAPHTSMSFLNTTVPGMHHKSCCLMQWNILEREHNLKVMCFKLYWPIQHTKSIQASADYIQWCKSNDWSIPTSFESTFASATSAKGSTFVGMW